MKSFLISTGILFIIAVFITTGSILVSRATDEILCKIDMLPTELSDDEEAMRNAAEAAKELDSFWHRRSLYLSAVVSYPWIANVDLEIIRLRESLASGAGTDYRTARTALYEAVSYIRKRESFAFYNFI